MNTMELNRKSRKNCVNDVGNGESYKNLAKKKIIKILNNRNKLNLQRGIERNETKKRSQKTNPIKQNNNQITLSQRNLEKNEQLINCNKNRVQNYLNMINENGIMTTVCTINELRINNAFFDHKPQL